MGNLSGLGKVAAVFVALAIGLEAYARSSGQPFTLNLLNPSSIASKMGNLNVPNPMANLVPQAPSGGGPPMSGPMPLAPGVSGRTPAVQMGSPPYTPMGQLV